ncbi:MAG: hypothetical protein MJA82_01170 [Clostridia bacterium]|nr:hypothetical protein [Clostridia bacterium]
MEGDNNKGRSYNFLTNLNNQSNIVNGSNISVKQVNSVFILISPYHMNKCNLEGLDIDLNIDEKGSIFIDDKEYEAVEVKPGIKIFGVIKG